MYHIFDVDGTITPPRKPMEPQYIPVFEEYCLNNKVILVSGSSISMIREQIPNSICSLVKLYGCSGIEGISYPLDYEINDDRLLQRLNSHLQLSIFDLKTGNHIEYRKGMINFSIVGRNATNEQRNSYSRFDSEYQERISIVKDLSNKFPQYEFRIGGEISIDITKKGVNKSIILKEIPCKERVTFYGNQIKEGNDKPIADYISSNNLGNVIETHYPNTFDLL